MISEQIFNQRLAIMRRGDMPKSVYLGHEDFYSLCHEEKASYVLQSNEERVTAYGLPVFLVDADHHCEVVAYMKNVLISEEVDALKYKQYKQNKRMSVYMSMRSRSGKKQRRRALSLYLQLDPDRTCWKDYIRNKIL